MGRTGGQRGAAGGYCVWGYCEIGNGKQGGL